MEFKKTKKQKKIIKKQKKLDETL